MYLKSKRQSLQFSFRDTKVCTLLHIFFPFMQLHASFHFCLKKPSEIIAAVVAYQYLQTIIFTLSPNFLIILGKCIGLKFSSLLLPKAKSLPGYLHLRPLFQILSQIHIFKCLLDIST